MTCSDWSDLKFSSLLLVRIFLDTISFKLDPAIYLCIHKETYRTRWPLLSSSVYIRHLENCTECGEDDMSDNATSKSQSSSIRCDRTVT